MVPVWLGLTALAATGGGLAGGRLLLDGLRRRRDRTALRSVTATSVADAADLVGPESGVADRRVCVTGTAEPVVGTLQAPFSERRALVADWSVTERGGVPLWRRAATGVDAVPFVVADDTGRALVWPTPDALALDGPHTTVAVDRDERAPDPVRRFLARPDAPDAAASALPGIPVTDGLDRRYAESHITPGDEVRVVAHPRPVPDGDPAREPDPAAADGGHPTVSVADADVAVALGPPWDEYGDPEHPVGLTQSGGPGPAPATDSALVVTDRTPDALAAGLDGATTRVAVGAGLLLAALALAGLGWSLAG